MLICHMDESGSQSTFTMACAISDDRKWLRLDKEWKKALDEFHVPYLHMRELIARKGPYTDWPQYRVDSFVRRFIWIFKSHVMGWCANTVIIRDFYEVVKTDRKKKLRNPYYHAFKTCISGALVFARDQSCADSVSFVLDRGGASEARLAYYLALFKQIEGLPRERLGVLLFGNDERNNALQAADLLAYEVQKHHQGFDRRSFSALREVSHVDYLWDSKRLREIFRQVPGVLV